MAETDALGWLMAWYASQCDGEWEHAYGIEISTLDNPGWELRIDLRGTPLENAPFEEQRFNYDDDASWWICRRTETSFEAFGGVRNLSAMVAVFREWATRHSTSDFGVAD